MTAYQQRCDVAVLVPAAGRGLRLGPGVPKALRLLGDDTLLGHVIRRVGAARGVGLVVVAAPAGSEPEVTALLAGACGEPVEVAVVPGGASRQESVAAALAAVPPSYEIVLVHDAARALAPVDLVERVSDAVRSGHDAVVPVLPLVDTVKQVDHTDHVIATPDRALLRVVQTPQGFRRTVLVAAHEAARVAALGAVQPGAATDDAMLVEHLGTHVFTVSGSPAAMKITHPHDLATAQLHLA